MEWIAAPRRADVLPQWTERLSVVIPAALVSVGLGIFVQAWSAHIGFYEQFGLRPEEIGLDYTMVITQAGTAAVMVTGLVLMIGLFFHAQASWFFAKRRSRIALIRIGVAAVVISAFLGLVIAPLTVGTERQVLLLLWTSLDLVVVAGFLFWGYTTGHRGLSLTLATLVFAGGLVVAYHTGVSTGRTLIRDASAAVQQSQDIPVIAPPPLVRLVSWPTVDVEVSVPADASPPRRGTDLESPRAVGFYLLGSRDGSFVLWDVCLDTIVLMPGDTTVLTHRDESVGVRAVADQRTEADQQTGGSGFASGGGGGFSCGGGAGI
ncbi:hypothetical protein ACI784_11250 [Geodermatophilus sp. SYSU D01186]